ncbi:MAG: hypothetical protein KatS3mg076_2579 [Candidatus Binatia bacterium]|nr:MAG: hypothetical protein KatS3mg076_2579 [Candidatus Binatia bacterium]
MTHRLSEPEELAGEAAALGLTTGAELDAKGLLAAWPVLLPEDRRRAFAMLARPEAEELFLAIPTRDQADLLLSLPRAREAILDPTAPAGRRGRSRAARAPGRARASALVARRAHSHAGARSPRLCGGCRGRAHEPALRPASSRVVGHRGHRIPSKVRGRASGRDVLRVRSRRRSATSRGPFAARTFRRSDPTSASPIACARRSWRSAKIRTRKRSADCSSSIVSWPCRSWIGRAG